MSTDMQWLRDLRTGDDVVIQWPGGLQAATVTDTTPTLIKTGPYSFHVRDGVIASGSTAHATLLPGTPERVEEAFRNSETISLRVELRGTDWNALPLNTLRAVSRMLRETQRALAAEAVLEGLARLAKRERV